MFAILAWPGTTFTRHTVAVGQMLMSALLIHLSGGRIETHFHVFGSLAFLAFYREVQWFPMPDAAAACRIALASVLTTQPRLTARFVARFTAAT